MKHFKKSLAVILAVMIIVLYVPVMASAVASGDFSYNILSDGTVKINGYNGSATKLTIPSTIDGYSVTGIGDYAFYYCESLESITVPDSITYIGNFGFFYCKNLLSITIPKSVTSIGDYSFYGCNDVTIYGYEGSYAQTYASEKNIPFYVIDKTELNADVFVFKIDDENIYYANQDVKFTAGSAATFDGNKKTIVPLRTIAAATGVTDLKYNAATKKITFTGFDGYKVEMQTGSTKCTLTKGSDKFEIQITAPYTKDGSAMLPLRDTVNLVGGYVKYENHYIVVSKAEIANADVAGYIAAYDAK